VHWIAIHNDHRGDEREADVNNNGAAERGTRSRQLANQERRCGWPSASFAGIKRGMDFSGST
jgi:hypothetical protein